MPITLNPGLTPLHSPTPDSILLQGEVSHFNPILSHTQNKKSLPLPGEPSLSPDLELPSPCSTPARSNSQTSISSIANECGHMNTSTLGYSAYVGEPREITFLGRVDRGYADPILRETATFDSPLTPCAHQPQLANLSGFLKEDRPISPFTPPETPAPESLQADSRLSSTSNSDQDLINFDSDQENDLPEVYSASGPQEKNGLHRNIDARSDAGSSAGDEDEELDRNSLYSTFTKNSSPYTRRAWEASKIILVPPRYLLPPEYLAARKEQHHRPHQDAPNSRVSDWEYYTASHALRQLAASPEVYVGYGPTSDGRKLHARLDSVKGEVEISFNTALPEEEDDNDQEKSREAPQTISLQGPPTSRFSMLNTTSTNISASSPHLPAVLSPDAPEDSFQFPVKHPASKQISSIRPASESTHQSSMDEDDGMLASCMEPLIPLPEELLSASRTVKILGETPVYRRRRPETVAFVPTAATSAPTPLLHPIPLDTNPSSRDISNRLSAISQVASNSNFKTVKKRDSKVRLRVPKWLTRTSKENLKSIESAPTTPQTSHPPPLRSMVIQEEGQPIIEKLRIIRVDNLVVPWGSHQITLESTTPAAISHPMQVLKSGQENGRRSQGSESYAMSGRQPSTSSRFSRRSSNLLRSGHSTISSESQSSGQQTAMDFSSDLAYLLDPPKQYVHLAVLFETTLREIITLTKEFCETLVYVQGYEDYIVQVINPKCYHCEKAVAESSLRIIATA